MTRLSVHFVLFAVMVLFEILTAGPLPPAVLLPLVLGVRTFRGR